MSIEWYGGGSGGDRSWVLCGAKTFVAESVSLQGQTFMVIGAAGELPKPPEKATVFLEGQ